MGSSASRVGPSSSASIGHGEKHGLPDFGDPLKPESDGENQNTLAVNTKFLSLKILRSDRTCSSTSSSLLGTSRQDDIVDHMKLAPVPFRLKWLQESGALASVAFKNESIAQSLHVSHQRWIEQLPRVANAARFCRLARKVHWLAWLLARAADATGAPARRAAALGDIETLHDLIEEHRNEGNGCCNRRDSKGRTPLWYAAKNGEKNCLNLLLSVLPITAIENVDNQGLSPTEVAYCSGNRQMLLQMITEHRSTLIRSPRIVAALLRGAIVHGDVHIMEQLIVMLPDRPSDFLKACTGGVPLLSLAVASNCPINLIQLLISSNPISKCINMTADATTTMTACHFGDGLPGAVVEGDSALHTAIRCERLSVVRLLILNGAEVHKRDGNRNTPIMISCSIGNAGIATFLLSKGGDLATSNVLTEEDNAGGRNGKSSGFKKGRASRAGRKHGSDKDRSLSIVSSGNRDSNLGTSGSGVIHSFLDSIEHSTDRIEAKDVNSGVQNTCKIESSQIGCAAFLVSRIDRAYNLQSAHTAAPSPGKASDGGRRNTNRQGRSAARVSLHPGRAAPAPGSRTKNSGSGGTDAKNSKGKGDDLSGNVDLYHLRARINDAKALHKRLMGEEARSLRMHIEELKHQAMATVNRKLQISMKRAETALEMITPRDLYSAVDGYPHMSLKFVGMGVTVLMGLGNGEELAMWDEFKFLVGNGAYGEFHGKLKAFDGDGLTEERVNRTETYITKVDETASYRGANAAKSLTEWMRARIEYFRVSRKINAKAFEKALSDVESFAEEGENFVSEATKRLKEVTKPLKASTL